MNLFSLMRQFTIRLRMLGAIGVVLGLLGLLGGAGMLGMFRIHDMSQNFMDNSVAKVSNMAELRGEMGAIRQHEKDMIIGYEKPEAVKAAHAKWLESQDKAKKIAIKFLEGEEAEVRQLFENIKRDRRHHCIFQFLDRQTQTAAFGDWSMGFFDLSGASDKVPGYNDFMNRMYTLNEPAAADNAYIRVLQRFRDGVPQDPAQFPDRTDELN